LLKRGDTIVSSSGTKYSAYKTTDSTKLPSPPSTSTDKSGGPGGAILDQHYMGTDSDFDSKIEVTNTKDERKLPSEVLAVRSGIGARLRGMGRGQKLTPIRTRITFKVSQSSSTATANTAAIALRPAASADFADLAFVYELVKVHGGLLRYNVVISGAAPTIPSLAVIAYDPVSNAVFASAAAACEASQHSLMCVAGALTYASAFPLSVTPSGLETFMFKVPVGPDVSNTSGTSNVTGHWADTRDDDNWGYLKPFIEAQGISTLTVLTGIVYMDVTFRSRD
jgi:hypothetical protein